MAAVIPASQLFDLTGEVALVTGASSGLGARFAQVLAAHGAKVVIAARRLDRLKALQEEIGSRAVAIGLDVAKTDTIPAAFDTAEHAFGKVSLLINNAGVAEDTRFLDMSKDEWERVRQTNVDGVWHVAQEAARRMVKAEQGGSIINISSMLAYRVLRGSAAYCVSKAAVMQMTGVMAIELARHNIRVNAIAPGLITTEMTDGFLNSSVSDATRKAIPQRRVGDASDLDGALLLLASRKASGYMTGTTIVADGGHMWSFA